MMINCSGITFDDIQSNFVRIDGCQQLVLQRCNATRVDMSKVCNSTVSRCDEIIVGASNVKHINIINCTKCKLFLQDFSYVSFEKIVKSVLFINNVLLGPTSTISIQRLLQSVVVVEHTSLFSNTCIV